MKSILVAIFVVGTGGTLAWHFTAPTINECKKLLGVNESCVVFSDAAQWNLSETETRRLKIREYPMCPWWLDPEIWWREDCAGGLPPRLPVPEGLR